MVKSRAYPGVEGVGVDPLNAHSVGEPVDKAFEVAEIELPVLQLGLVVSPLLVSSAVELEQRGRQFEEDWVELESSIVDLLRQAQRRRNNTDSLGVTMVLQEKTETSVRQLWIPVIAKVRACRVEHHMPAAKRPADVKWRRYCGWRSSDGCSGWCVQEAAGRVQQTAERVQETVGRIQYRQSRYRDCPKTILKRAQETINHINETQRPCPSGRVNTLLQYSWS